MKKPKEEVTVVTSRDYRVPGLTEVQVEARGKGLGGSDAERIMAGDWMNLWREKTGRAKAEDLSYNLAVQLGKVTEAFNAYWYTLKTGVVVDRSPDLIERTHTHRKYPWMVANIDGLVTIDQRQRLWEGKHTNPFGSKGDAPAKYLAQVQHCLEVLDLEGVEMSVLFGNSDWLPFTLERDQDYGALLMEREAEFWEYVVKDQPPPGDRDAGPPAPGLELMRAIDMRANNLWGNHEAIWIEARPHRVRFDEAESALKQLVAGDCDFAYGSELVCVRDRAGKLSLRYPTKKDAERMREAIESAALELEI